jgi:hypothetical protein
VISRDDVRCIAMEDDTDDCNLRLLLGYRGGAVPSLESRRE